MTVRVKVPVVSTIFARVTLVTKHWIAPNARAFLAEHGVTSLTVTIRPTTTLNVRPTAFATARRANAHATTVSPATHAAILLAPMAATAMVLANTLAKLLPIRRFSTVQSRIVITTFGMPKNHASVSVIRTGLVQIALHACAPWAMTL